MFDTVVAGQGQEISSLAEATGGRFLLNHGLIGTLANYTGFKELRVRCSKPWHGRTEDVVLKGEYLLKALTQFAPKHGFCGQNEIRFLSEDTSTLSTTDCTRLRTGLTADHFGVYDHLLYAAESVTHSITPCKPHGV